jgi:hypothetical protein
MVRFLGGRINGTLTLAMNRLLLGIYWQGHIQDFVEGYFKFARSGLWLRRTMKIKGPRAPSPLYISKKNRKFYLFIYTLSSKAMCGKLESNYR